MPIAENRRSILNDSPNALIAKNTVAPTIINEKCSGSLAIVMRIIHSKIIVLGNQPQTSGLFYAALTFNDYSRYKLLFDMQIWKKRVV